ncbi:MAG TPA: twin-arginine translocation signal domain-containing protein [Pseudomonadales bacterium]|nr:twin-arginine translocation signal domain-containing protein [Pseudomonadales bacterium]
MSEDDSPTGLSRRGFIKATAAMAGPLLLPSIALATADQKAGAVKPKVDLDHFVQDCIDANGEADSQAAVLEVLARAVHDPHSMLRALGEPQRAGISVIHRSPTLTIFNAAWTPRMNLMPHDHLMWANIGIYTGREDNIFWHRGEGRIEAVEAKALFEGDAAPLMADAIHSVTNPLLRYTGGIHIYGGDFFATTRSEWDPESMDERPSDGDSIRRMFERENERLGIPAAT